MFWKEFLIGGTTVSAISYVGNNLNPVLAGLIGGIPIALPSLYFIKNDRNIKLVSTTLLVSTLLLFATVVVFYYLRFIRSPGLSKNQAIVQSMLVWLVVTIILWKGKIPNKLGLITE
jgi:uncharacterized membrane protein (GlpM family)